MIVEVRAYLDSAMVAWTITRNEQLRADPVLAGNRSSTR